MSDFPTQLLVAAVLGLYNCRCTNPNLKVDSRLMGGINFCKLSISCNLALTEVFVLVLALNLLLHALVRC